MQNKILTFYLFYFFKQVDNNINDLHFNKAVDPNNGFGMQTKYTNAFNTHPTTWDSTYYMCLKKSRQYKGCKKYPGNDHKVRICFCFFDRWVY